MDKKKVQKRRMMGYFIEATRQIIERDGIEAVNIRRVSDIAGYNSATLYNYFEDLNGLIFFTSLGYLKEYTQSLALAAKNLQDSLEKYFAIWRCFCNHSFARPQIYHGIFFEKYSNSLNHDIKEYYAIFPEELGNHDEDLKAMLLGNNFMERNLFILNLCVKEHYIKEENVNDINEMCILIYQGMLERLLSKQVNYTIEEATEKILSYHKHIIDSY